MENREKLEQIADRVQKLPEDQQRLVMAYLRGMEAANTAAAPRSNEDTRSA